MIRPVPVVLEACGRTDVGRVRTTNEDQFLIANLNKSMVVEQSSLSLQDQTQLQGVLQGTLLLVADGMGGHAAGDVASRLAVETAIGYVLNTMPWFYRLDEAHGDDLVQVLEEALARCEAAIEAQQSDGASARMGTTLTMAYVLWPKVYLLHAGDSRCYLLRGGRLRQLTRDHTLAQRIIDETDSSPEEVDEDRLGHVLWNAVGANVDEPVVADVSRYELAHGDTLVLCSDGLTGLVADDRILGILSTAETSERACELLVDEANREGGGDNITAVVARFRAEGAGS